MAEVDKWVCPDCGIVKNADHAHVPERYFGDIKENCSHCEINFGVSTEMEPVLKNDEV